MTHSSLTPLARLVAALEDAPADDDEREGKRKKTKQKKAKDRKEDSDENDDDGNDDETAKDKKEDSKHAGLNAERHKNLQKRREEALQAAADATTAAQRRRASLAAIDDELAELEAHPNAPPPQRPETPLERVRRGDNSDVFSGPTVQRRAQEILAIGEVARGERRMPLPVDPVARQIVLCGMRARGEIPLADAAPVEPTPMHATAQQIVNAAAKRDRPTSVPKPSGVALDIINSARRARNEEPL